MESANGIFYLTNINLNLEIYRLNDANKDFVLWSTNVQNFNSFVSPFLLTIQNDGNLYYLDSNYSIIWNTNVSQTVQGAYKSVLQNDGNLVILNPNGTLIWSTNITSIFFIIFNYQKMFLANKFKV